MDLTLHGGGQGFESPRLHFKTRGISGVLAPNQIVNGASFTRLLGSVEVTFSRLESRTCPQTGGIAALPMGFGVPIRAVVGQDPRGAS